MKVKKLLLSILAIVFLLAEKYSTDDSHLDEMNDSEGNKFNFKRLTVKEKVRQYARLTVPQ